MSSHTEPRLVWTLPLLSNRGSLLLLVLTLDQSSRAADRDRSHFAAALHCWASRVRRERKRASPLSVADNVQRVCGRARGSGCMCLICMGPGKSSHCLKHGGNGTSLVSMMLLVSGGSAVHV